MCDYQHFNQRQSVTASSDLPLGGGEKDLLNMGEYHESLVDLIKGADTPITIALEGEWGSGKSSIMNIIKGELCDGVDAEFYGITVKTWQYDLLNDSSHNASSLAVVKILQSMINSIIELKPNREQQKRIDNIINKIAIAASGAKSIYDVIGDPLLTQVGLNKGTVGFIGKVINAIKSAVDNGNNKESNLNDNSSLIVQLHDEVEKLVTEILRDPDQKQIKQIFQYYEKTEDGSNDERYFQLDVQQFSFVIVKLIAAFYNSINYLATIIVLLCKDLLLSILDLMFIFFKTLWEIFCYILKAISDVVSYSLKEFCSAFCDLNKIQEKNELIDGVNKKKIIFFIDDLDRVKPEMALEILEIFNNIFNIEDCIFIIAFDPSVLNEVLTKKLGSITPEDPYKHERYLEKLIQIIVPAPVAFYDIVPLLRKGLVDRGVFTDKELESNELQNFLKRVVELSIGTNPRSIKLLMNQVSLLNRLTNKIWLRYAQQYQQGCIDIISKQLSFVVYCISLRFRDVYMLLVYFPYFKEWDNSALIEGFDIPPANPKLLQQLKLLRDIDLLDFSNHERWELVLFRICQYKLSYYHNDFQKFDNILKLLKTIDDLFNELAQGDDAKYKKLIKRLFDATQKHALSDDIPFD